MKSAGASLRHRKTAVEVGNDDSTARAGAAAATGTVQKRKRRRRKAEDIHKSWLLAAITISAWLLIFTKWPRDADGIDTPGFHQHDNGENFHRRLRRGRNSLRIFNSGKAKVPDNKLKERNISQKDFKDIKPPIKDFKERKLPPTQANLKGKLDKLKTKDAQSRTLAKKSLSNETVARARGASITCPGGSKGIINDDYCDCSDGSDEPGTSGCSHILVQTNTFACRDGRTFIYPSRVKDGIEDCPDGSDERF